MHWLSTTLVLRVLREPNKSDKEKPIEKGAELLTLKNKMSAFLVNPGVMISMSVFLTFTILCLTPLNQ